MAGLPKRMADLSLQEDRRGVDLLDGNCLTTKNREPRVSSVAQQVAGSGDVTTGNGNGVAIEREDSPTSLNEVSTAEIPQANGSTSSPTPSRLTSVPDGRPLEIGSPQVGQIREAHLDEKIIREVRGHMKTIDTFYSGERMYRMAGVPRGYCVIVDNRNFQNKDYDRLGSEKDGYGLRDVFTQLGFSVFYYVDLTAREMEALFTNFSKQVKSSQDCFVGIILSHGFSGNLLYGVDGSMIDLRQIVDNFNNEKCPELITRPKLFFIQSCRGNEKDVGVRYLNHVADAVGLPASASLKQTATQEIIYPTWSDIMICFSTIDGYVSLRNTNTGSWFGDALIKVLREHACDMELHALLTRVNERLMQREGSSLLKQSTEIQYRGWSKDFYFNPGHRRTLTECPFPPPFPPLPSVVASPSGDELPSAVPPLDDDYIPEYHDA